MNRSRPNTSETLGTARDRSRRKRELVLIAACLVVVALLTYVETRIIYFGVDFPISNTILMFILININLLLLLLVIFLVFRNLVKLLYDRKHKVIGSRLTTRLVFSFIALSLLPTTVLFLFSLNFITTSIEYWFNVPVEQALDNSLRVGRRVYDQTEEENRFFLERIAFQIKTKNLLLPNNQKALARYVEVVQRSFNLIDRAGREHQMRIFHDVVNVDPFGAQDLDVGEVAGRQFQIAVVALDHHQGLAQFEALEHVDEALGADLIQFKSVDHHQLLIAEPGRQSALESRFLDLAVELELVGARNRPENRATAGVIRGATAPLPGVAGAFLLVRLPAATPDFTAPLGLGCPLTARCQLVAHHIVDQVFLDLGIEHRIFEFALGDLVAVDVVYSDLRHGQTPVPNRKRLTASWP